MCDMNRTYTPLDVKKLEEKYEANLPAKHQSHEGFDSIFNTVLIFLATLTVLVISIVLFILIQQQLKTQTRNSGFRPVAAVRTIV